MKHIRSMFGLWAMALAIFGLVAAASAQSKDQSSPTALTSGEYLGKSPIKETTYFFNFNGGPGEVSVRLEISAKQYSTFARLEIIDAELNTLATHNMNAATTSGTAQVLKKLTLDEKQTLMIKLTLDGNLASYKIALGGAVDSGTAPSTGQAGSDTGGTTEAGTSTESGGAPETGSTSSSTDPNSGGSGSTASPSTGNNKFFNVDLGKFKLGQFINFPKNGTLVIHLKDGTTQELDLANVKNVTIKK